MSEVALNIQTCYLAGPMRGHENLNFPEFHKQAAWLRAGGWNVFSPAERDESDPVLNGDFSVGQERGLDYYMQFDLAAVAQADCVIAMEGWETSQGARLEMVTAVELGHPVFEIVYGDLDDTPRYFRRLASVNPEYVRVVFFGQGVPDISEEEREHVTEPGVQCWCDPEVVTIPAEETISSDGAEDFLAISAFRKASPIASGVLDYFPAALLEVSRVSKAGNDKHNPGQPLHHARGKSTDHADSLLRHLIDRGKIDEETGQRHSAEVAWRALAMLQQELEDEGLAALPRGAKL